MTKKELEVKKAELEGKIVKLNEKLRFGSSGDVAGIAAIAQMKENLALVDAALKDAPVEDVPAHEAPPAAPEAPPVAPEAAAPEDNAEPEDVIETPPATVATVLGAAE